MPTLKGLYQEAAKGGAALFVTGPHARFIEDQTKYTEEAAEFVKQAILEKFKHPREGRFSPSSLGKCPRRNLFSFAGVPQLPPTMEQRELMIQGTFSHLRWQCDGMSAGWMVDAEIWTYDPHYRVGGSIDGLLEDFSLFELKTVIGSKYNRICQIDNAPDFEHRLQLQTYFHMEGVVQGSIVYEERGAGQFHEFRVEADDLLERDLISRLERLNNWVEDNKLPPMLADCERGVGYVFKGCPYREHCPKAKRLFEPQEEAA